MTSIIQRVIWYSISSRGEQNIEINSPECCFPIFLFQTESFTTSFHHFISSPFIMLVQQLLISAMLMWVCSMVSTGSFGNKE
jgi:hypothetical protein